MNIGDVQVKGALYRILHNEKLPFYISVGHCPQFLENPSI